MTRSLPRSDPLGRLADALVEDILETSGAELLAESAEDYRDAHALSAELDGIIKPIMRRFGAQKSAAGSDEPAWSVAANDGSGAPVDEAEPETHSGSLRWWHFRRRPGVHLSRQGAERTIDPGTASGAFAWLLEFWQSLGPPIGVRHPRGLGVVMASLLIFVAGTGVAALYWANKAPTRSPDVFTQAAFPAGAPPPGGPQLQPATGPASIAGGMAYSVQLAWQRRQQDVVVNYLLGSSDLRDKVPNLFRDNGAAIRQIAGGGTYTLQGFTLEQARAFCDQFKTTGGECNVREP